MDNVFTDVILASPKISKKQIVIVNLQINITHQYMMKMMELLLLVVNVLSVLYVRPELNGLCNTTLVHTVKRVTSSTKSLTRNPGAADTTQVPANNRECLTFMVTVYQIVIKLT